MTTRDNETPPEGWTPSEEDKEQMRRAPYLDLDLHLGGEAEEKSGLEWLKGFNIASNNPIFTCSKCGAKHLATLTKTTKISDEEIQKLKEAWYKSSDRLFAPWMERFDKLSISFEAMEQERPKEYKATQLAEVKACAAYLAAKQDRLTWSVPDTLVTVKIKGKEGTYHQLQCVEPCRKKHSEKGEWMRAKLTELGLDDIDPPMICRPPPRKLPHENNVGQVHLVRYDGFTILAALTTSDGIRETIIVLNGASQKEFESAEKAWVGVKVKFTGKKWVRI